MKNDVLGKFQGGFRSDGTKWTIELIACDQFTERFSPVTAVLGIVLADQNVLAIRNKRGWDIPGGYVEPGETAYEALVREMQEEAGFKVISAHPTFYLRTDYDPKLITYMLAFNTQGELEEPFCLAHEVQERVLMHVPDFLKQYTAGSIDLMRVLLGAVADSPRFCYTYLLECADGSMYCGWTVDLDARLKAHNEGKGARYTRSRLPVKLLKSWKFETQSEAMKFEVYIKNLSRSQKEELLK